MKKTSIKSVVWKEGRHYVAQCLNFDVSSFGSTKLSAIKNLREAIVLFLEDYQPQKFPTIQSAQIIQTTI